MNFKKRLKQPHSFKLIPFSCEEVPVLYQNEQGTTLIPLIRAWQPLFENMAEVGPCIMLFHNSGAVLCESVARTAFEEVPEEVGNGNEFIELSTGALLSPINWKYVFAFERECVEGTKTGIQFGDTSGQTVLELLLTDEANIDFFRELVLSFASPERVTWPEAKSSGSSQFSQTTGSPSSNSFSQKVWPLFARSRFESKVAGLEGLHRRDVIAGIGIEKAFPISAQILQRPFYTAQQTGMRLLFEQLGEGLKLDMSFRVKKQNHCKCAIHLFGERGQQLHLLQKAALEYWVVLRETNQQLHPTLEAYSTQTGQPLYAVSCIDSNPYDRKTWLGQLLGLR